MSRFALGQVTAKSPESAVVQAHGLLFGTQVLTADGALPVEYLIPGDRIITRTGMKTLQSIDSHIQPHARVVRMMKGGLGGGRPEVALVVTPDQPILLRDWRAKAITGQTEAMIPADRLADGVTVRLGVETQARMFRLHFAEDTVIYAGGLELACAPLPAPVTA